MPDLGLLQRGEVPAGDVGKLGHVFHELRRRGPDAFAHNLGRVPRWYG